MFHWQACIETVVKQKSELEGYALKSVTYHSQSLFPLYRLQLVSGKQNLQPQELFLAAKLMRDERMARTEEEGLQALRERQAPVPRTYGYYSEEGNSKSRGREYGKEDPKGKRITDDKGERATGAKDKQTTGDEGKQTVLLMQFIEPGPLMSEASPTETEAARKGGKREKNPVISKAGTVPTLCQDLLALYSSSGERFGWHEDNFIGTLPQPNRWHRRFTEFWWQERLEPQIRRAYNSGRLAKKNAAELQALTTNCSAAWKLEESRPTLIHGDLWSGNLLTGPGNRKFLIDPSVSYGNPEQDLAMLDLFGSPLKAAEKEKIAQSCGCGADYHRRVPFWQIYPLLIHLNIFGSSYLRPLEAAIRSCGSISY